MIVMILSEIVPINKESTITIRIKSQYFWLPIEMN